MSANVFTYFVGLIHKTVLFVHDKLLCVNAALIAYCIGSIIVSHSAIQFKNNKLET